ncbi:MAG: hypothetical protein ACE5EK_08905 [Nitrospinales bacterium]
MNNLQFKKWMNDPEFCKWVEGKTVRHSFWLKAWKWVSRPFRYYSESVSELAYEDFPKSEPKHYSYKKNRNEHNKRKARWPQENALAQYNAHYARLASMQNEDESITE